MLSKKINMLSALSAAVFSMSLIGTGNIVKAETIKTEVERLSGENRYATSVSVSKQNWNNGTDYVIVASGNEFADALCASPLAKKYNAPVLLSKKDTVGEKVLEEISRLKAKHIIIIGGTEIISSKAENELKGIDSSIKVERIGGKNRYETSMMVAKKLEAKKIVVASGTSYADAISIASIAAQKGMPIILTEKTQLPKEVKDYIGSKDIEKAYILGGTGVVSDKVENELKNAVRIGGEDRYDTNKKVLEAFANEVSFKKVFLAKGGATKTDFADGLIGAAAASKEESPVMLVAEKADKETIDFSKEYFFPTTEILTIGGEVAIPENVPNSLVVKAEMYSKDGAKEGSKDSSKPSKVSGNIDIRGNNITVENEQVSGNVYVEGDKAVVSNVDTEGTVYVHPGKDGTVNLKNVKAKRVKVLSGATKSIHLEAVETDELEIASKNNVRVELDSRCKVKKATVSSAVILESHTTHLDNLVIVESSQYDKQVELKGQFKKVQISGESKLKVGSSTKIDKVVIKDIDKDAKIELRGHIKELTVEDEIAELRLGDGCKLDKLVAEKEVGLEFGSNAKVTTIEAAKGVKVKALDGTKLPKIYQKGKAPSASSSSGSSASSSKKHSSSSSSSGDHSNPSHEKSESEKALERVQPILEAIEQGMNLDQSGQTMKIDLKSNNLPDASLKDFYLAATEHKAKFIKLYGKISDLKREFILKNKIDGTNYKDMRNDLLNKLNIKVDKNASEKEIIKEVLDKLDGHSYEAVITRIKGIKSLETYIPRVTIGETDYFASKVTVTIDGEKVAATGDTDEGVTKNGNRVKVTAQELINTCKKVLKDKFGYTDGLSNLSVNDILSGIKKDLTVIVQFTDEDGNSKEFKLVISK